MPNKTLSVRDDDVPLWERAERAAKQERTTVSALVATALAAYLGKTGTIKVIMYGWPDNTETYYRAFEGRWLIEPPMTSEQHHPRSLDTPRPPEYGMSGKPAEWRYGVAETARGRIAVYIHHWNYNYDCPPELHVFDTAEQAAAALKDDPRVDTRQFAHWSTKLPGRATEHPVEWRDI